MAHGPYEREQRNNSSDISTEITIHFDYSGNPDRQIHAWGAIIIMGDHQVSVGGAAPEVGTQVHLGEEAAYFACKNWAAHAGVPVRWFVTDNQHIAQKHNLVWVSRGHPIQALADQQARSIRLMMEDACGANRDQTSPKKDRRINQDDRSVQEHNTPDDTDQFIKQLGKTLNIEQQQCMRSHLNFIEGRTRERIKKLKPRDIRDLASELLSRRQQSISKRVQGEPTWMIRFRGEYLECLRAHWNNLSHSERETMKRMDHEEVRELARFLAAQRRAEIGQQPHPTRELQWYMTASTGQLHAMPEWLMCYNTRDRHTLQDHRLDLLDQAMGRNREAMQTLREFDSLTHSESYQLVKMLSTPHHHDSLQRMCWEN